ncbi:LysE family translocator [Exilibacterium tricleocarpae]|uniref:LysE family translocator n=1 Tax=Exilibacterium tricleocarpae TaxID=2591008 RepID=A0A545T0J1_9GAMM|nr:LysE family translocator [Exilibacterium tricleocarpae]TQV70726.1 LysE family translocator [Exilibacterium tricleocarpae]
MDFAQIASFSLVALLLVVSPGPNGVLIAKTVPTSGRAAGFANVAGFLVAFYIHGALSILGLSVILMQSAQAFLLVKIIGALYLIWIGVKALLSAWQGDNTTRSTVPTKPKRSLSKAFVEGFLTNALNPKVSMFYMAAFPQFIPVEEGAMMNALLLVSIHSLMNMIWFASLVILFSRLVATVRSGWFQRVFKGITGAIFIGFGVKLATLKAN